MPLHLRHSRRLRTILTAATLLALLATTACGGAEARRDRYLEKAQALIAEEDWPKAQLELRNALQIDPNDMRAKVLLAEVAERIGEPRQAAQQYRSVLDTDPKNAPARAGLARLYALGGLPQEALELANEGLARHPDDAALLTARAAAHAQLGETAPALADAEKAHALDPRSRHASAVLASLYANANRRADAIALITQSVQLYPRDPDLQLILANLQEANGDRAAAARAYATYVRLDPTNLGRRILQVQFLLRGDDVDAAEASLREGVAAAPKALEPKLALAGLLASKRDFAAGEKALLELVERSPDDLELQVGLADFYAAQSHPERADAIYRKLVASDGKGPQGLKARNRLAASAIRARDTATADKLLAEVLAENPQDNEALAMRAQLALARNDAPAAIGDLRALLRDKPESIPAQRALAQAYVANGDLALAEQTLRSSLEGAPGDAPLQMSYAQLLLRTGRTAQAQAALEQAVAHEPGNLAAQELLFRLQGEQHDYAAALQTARTVKSARPELGLGDYLQGLAERAQGKTDLALESFERALKLQPDAAEPLTALTQTLIASGQLDAAAKRVDAAIALRPANLHARNLRAELLLGQKRYPEAIAAYEDTVRRAPSWWLPYRGEATAYRLQNDVEKAIATYRKGLQASNAPELLVDLTGMQESLGRIDDAVATYEAYLVRNPKSTAAANNLAMLLVTHKSDAASLARARSLATTLERSGVPTFVNTAGWVRLKTGDVDGALPLLARAAETDPDAPQLRYMLGVAQAQAGRKPEAIATLQSALAMNKPFAGSQDAQAVLAQLKSP